MDNRHKILQCALQLFAQYGYDGVGVQEIASMAGITKPTMYHYFGNKQGVLYFLVKEYFYILLEDLTKATQYTGDLPLTLHRVVSVFFQFIKNHPDFYRMILSMAFAPPQSEPYKTLEPAFLRQFQLLEAVFLAATNDHGNMRGRQQAYAATFLGMINTYAQLYFVGACDLSDELTFKALHQFMHGIYS
jgi:TetR/AcrR family transcriptional regulator